MAGVLVLLAGAPSAAFGQESVLEESTRSPGTVSTGTMNTAMPRVHDPSTLVRCKDAYWLFATGNGVASYRSTNLIQWVAGPRVFATAPEWVKDAVPGNRGHFWAPDIIPVKGRYLLFYSVSTWGRNTSAIALASNPTLDPGDPAFRWTDEGIVVQSSQTNDFNAIDPGVLLASDGRLWMAFGSFWSGIQLIELDPATGKRPAGETRIYHLAGHREIEAPALLQEGGYYYLFVNWGLCCRGIESTYSIRVGRSREITGPYLDADGKDLREGGGTAFLDSAGDRIGPGHPAFFREGTNLWMSHHFYDGARRGAPALAVRQLNWNAGGWPQVGQLSPTSPAVSGPVETRPR